MIVTRSPAWIKALGVLSLAIEVLHKVRVPQRVLGDLSKTLMVGAVDDPQGEPDARAHFVWMLCEHVKSSHDRKTRC